MSVACNKIHQNVEGFTYFMPTHCREPLLKGTRNFVKRTGEGCNHLSGENFFGFGKISGLSCIRGDDIPTGVYEGSISLLLDCGLVRAHDLHAH